MVSYHNPVLLKASVAGLSVREDGTYVDVTYGGGGHSSAILALLGKKGRLLAFDRDGDAASAMTDDPRFLLVRHNFRFLKNYLKYYGALPVDGILADLGVSSHQFDQGERGFSTRFSAELDMRMDRRKKKTAAHVVSTASFEELASIFRSYGELDQAGRIADALILFRTQKPIETTDDLKEAIQHLIPPRQEQKFLARVFQALRIEVNGELDALKSLLEQSLQVLRPGGRLVVISYHSLEDRLVKNFMKTGNTAGIEEKDPIYGKLSSPFILVTRKAVLPDEAEIGENPRARSAKLRIAEKI